MNTFSMAAAALCLALAGGPVFAQQGFAQQGPGPLGHGGPGPAQGKPAPGAKAPGPGMNMGGMGGQGMMGGMMGGGGQQMMQMGPGKHVEGRLAFLRAEIAVTEAQTPVWNAFADAVRKAGKDMMASMPMMMQPPATRQKDAKPGDAKADWLANLERHEQAMAARLEGLRAIRAAAQPLYAAFSDEQKRVANDLMAGPMGPMGGIGAMMRM